MKKILFSVLLFLLYSSTSRATHLMGGSLTYQFLYHDSGTNKDHYRVKLQLFRDCSSMTQLADPITLGVYAYSSGNPQLLITTYSLNQDSLQLVNPPSPGDSCSFTTSVCVQEGDYHVDISLGSGTGGYYLLSQLNARNGVISNLDMPLNLGQTYFAFIPPSTITNSSPAFADIPVPFICTSDTVSIVNLATDADGDSLAYSFVVPYNSYTMGPTPPAPATISVPPPIVPYATTYSLTQPFGPGGYANIDPVSGLTQYYIPNTGNYVVCVQIDEYRNGVLIASTRRDLQLIAIACPANPPPVLNTSGGSGITVYNIEEGQTLCFPVSITDPNGDSVYVSATGILFDSTLVYPAATFHDTSGKPTATTQFCWTTGCGQGRTAPYQFTVSSLDDGCPPKVANVVYSIYVRPAASPSTINGPDSVCNMQQGVNYNTALSAGSTYHWTITNGSQASGGITTNITVNWGNAAIGNISVFAVSQYGCTRDTISRNVVLKPLPVTDAGIDTGFCSGQSVMLGTASTPGTSYSWSPVTGMINDTSSNPTVSLTNVLTVSVNYQYILTATNNGCSNKDTTMVTVRPFPVSPGITDRFACSGDSIQLGAAAKAGYTYLWNPSTGLDDDTLSNPTLVVSNLTSSDDTLDYFVSTSLGGCITMDTVRIIVHPLPLVTAISNPDSICAGDTSTLQGSGAATFSWANSLSPGVSIGTGDSIAVHPSVSSSYILTGTAATGCKNTSSVALFVSPIPIVTATANPDSVCSGGNSTITATGAANYWWANLLQPNDTIITGPSLFITPDSAMSFVVTGISSFGCVSKDTAVININPAPLADSIFGTRSLCPGVTGVGYVVLHGASNSTYQWIVESGTIASGQGTDTMFANWDTLSGPGAVKVIETTDRGCISDTIELPVNINVILTPASPFGITPICEENSDSSVYTTFNTPGSVYTWGVLNGTLISANGSNTIIVDWDSTGNNSGVIWYLENSTTTDTLCFGISDTLYVTIHLTPVTSSILGDLILCAFDTGIAYQVAPTAGSVYSWNVSGGSITGIDSTNLIHVNWGSAGNDTITVIETNVNGCVGLPVDTIILIHPLPPASAGPDTAVCYGDTIRLNASGGTGYLWSPSAGLDSIVNYNPLAFPLSPTQYIVRVTDGNSCINFDTVQVAVHLLPVVDAGLDSNMCFGYGINLTATGGTKYIWTPGITLNDSTIYNPHANPASTTVYYVVGTDANQCQNVDSVKITVLALPNANAGTDTIVCKGSGVRLVASGGTTYLWTPSIGLNNIHIYNPIASPTSITTYTVSVTDANHCTKTDQVIVDVNPMPSSDFTAVDYVPACNGLGATFQNNSTNDLSYEWIFGDGTSSTTERNPTHVYAYGGTYVISLLTNNSFCRDSAGMEIPAIGIGNALDSLSNVFTPDNDGFNDCFQVTPTGGISDCATMAIFNRWGEIVFEGDANHHCWNGKTKGGSDCQPGVYFYVVKVGNATSKGTVELIRN